MEALRQPLEDGRVAIVRARYSATYPARFALVAATNPCPCGYLGEDDRCTCSEGDLARHRRKLSGPLLDRIDLVAHLSRPTRHDLSGAPVTDTARARERVVLARERQTRRHREGAVDLNCELDARALRHHLALDGSAERLLANVLDRRLLSGRGLQRLLSVARTAADLDGSARTRERDLCTALALRPETSVATRRAA